MKRFSDTITDGPEAAGTNEAMLRRIIKHPSAANNTHHVMILHSADIRQKKKEDNFAC